MITYPDGPAPYLIWEIQEHRTLATKRAHRIEVELIEYTCSVSKSAPTGLANNSIDDGPRRNTPAKTRKRRSPEDDDDDEGEEEAVELGESACILQFRVENHTYQTKNIELTITGDRS